MAPPPSAVGSRSRSPPARRRGQSPLRLLLGLLLVLLPLHLALALPSNSRSGFVSSSSSSLRPRMGSQGTTSTTTILSAAASAAAAAANGAGGSKRVAVLGAGAAGLVASRLLREAGFGVRCFEKTDSVGGVWRYRPEDVMYRSLVTNLPKEIMAYLDTPFDPSLPSFLGHAQVQAYLEAYAKSHRLTELVAFHTEVKAVRPISASSSSLLPDGDYSTPSSDAEEGTEPRWRVSYATQQGAEQEEEFDAVVVANGHFEVAYTPHFPGLREHYRGRVLHSRNYDDPSVCAGLRVLCVGYKSSGTDIAREIAAVAKEVHVVDRRVKPQQAANGNAKGAKPQQELRRGNIYRRPELVRFLEDGGSVEFADGSVLGGVDLVLICTGYEYSMPFLCGGSPPTPNTNEKGARLVRVEDRAVFPVYQHLFHARFPTLSFMGLLHSVVPFPLFDLQAKWIVQHLSGQSPLPPPKERFAWLETERARQQALGRKPRDWFYMGAEQWPCMRMMAQRAHCLTPALEEELVAREGIYNDVSGRRPAFPGADDAYRRCEYRIVAGGKFEVDLGKYQAEGSNSSSGKEEPAFL